MASGTWVHLVALLLVTTLAAGCTNRDGDAGGDDGAGGGAGGGAGNGGNATGPLTDTNVTDSGTIQGPFARTWDIEVPSVGFTSATVHFALTGVQAGAPPTARINLALLDPDGNAVMTDVVGLGGSGDSIDWTLTNAEFSVAGTYTLQATSGGTAPLPSGGLANYELAASVTY